jgi:hypothetical protein
MSGENRITKKRRGPKPGSPPRGGRPKGAATLRTREIADKAAAEGVTPLEVMLEAMRDARDAKNLKDAATYANMAAPYMHPRLSSVTATTQVQGSMQITLIDEFGET